MASKFLSALSLLALIASPSLAGLTTYASYNPYFTGAALAAAPATYHSTPVGTAYTYSSPAAFAAYHHPHHAHPVVYQQQQQVITAAPASVYSYSTSPVVQTYAAPAPVAAAVHVAAPAPVLTKTVVAAAPAPLVASAVPVLKATPAAVAVARAVEFEGSPRYDFSYGVHDSVTGDIKSQAETRDGGSVSGSYSVVDADGYKRTVTYTADDLNGFNAVVQREPIVATKLATVAVAAPVVPAVAPVQQHHHFQYLPQVGVQQPIVPVQQQPIAPVAGEAPTAASPVDPDAQAEVVEVPQQHQPEAAPPTPVEYPVEQGEQPQYPQDQQFPPFGQAENDDSDVIEARTAKTDGPSTTAAPAPVTENHDETEKTKQTA